MSSAGVRRWVKALATVVISVSVLSPSAEVVFAGQQVQSEGLLNSTSLGDCNGGGAGGDFGKVWVERVRGNLVRVTVLISKGRPNETYVINVSCAGSIGTVKTNRYGYGFVRLLPTDSWGLKTRTLIVIDVHLANPNGADPARTPGMYLPT